VRAENSGAGDSGGETAVGNGEATPSETKAGVAHDAAVSGAKEAAENHGMLASESDDTAVVPALGDAASATQVPTSSDGSSAKSPSKTGKGPMLGQLRSMLMALEFNVTMSSEYLNQLSLRTLALERALRRNVTAVRNATQETRGLVGQVMSLMQQQQNQLQLTVTLLSDMERRNSAESGWGLLWAMLWICTALLLTLLLVASLRLNMQHRDMLRRFGEAFHLAAAPGTPGAYPGGARLGAHINGMSGYASPGRGGLSSSMASGHMPGSRATTPVPRMVASTTPTAASSVASGALHVPFPHQHVWARPVTGGGGGGRSVATPAGMASSTATSRQPSPPLSPRLMHTGQFRSEEVVTASAPTAQYVSDMFSMQTPDMTAGGGCGEFGSETMRRANLPATRYRRESAPRYRQPDEDGVTTDEEMPDTSGGAARMPAEMCFGANGAAHNTPNGSQGGALPTSSHGPRRARPASAVRLMYVPTSGDANGSYLAPHPHLSSGGWPSPSAFGVSTGELAEGANSAMGTPVDGGAMMVQAMRIAGHSLGLMAQALSSAAEIPLWQSPMADPPEDAPGQEQGVHVPTGAAAQATAGGEPPLAGRQPRAADSAGGASRTATAKTKPTPLGGQPSPLGSQAAAPETLQMGGAAASPPKETVVSDADGSIPAGLQNVAAGTPRVAAGMTNVSQPLASSASSSPNLSNRRRYNSDRC
jgi:hypothetical protein